MIHEKEDFSSKNETLERIAGPSTEWNRRDMMSLRG